MKPLPEALVYEAGLQYWPYKSSLDKVLNLIGEYTPRRGTLLDVMCGPGYLLGQIAQDRSDISLTGVDIDDRYISYGDETYPEASFIQGDVLSWCPEALFDVVVCTGAVHHVPYEQQETAIANIASMVNPDGFVIISDVYVDEYTDEIERKLAAARLGYEYLAVTIQNAATDDVVGWTADILWNDVMMEEYKTSYEKRLRILKRHFPTVVTFKTWPSEELGGYGDYIHVCSLE